MVIHSEASSYGNEGPGIKDMRKRRTGYDGTTDVRQAQGSAWRMLKVIFERETSDWGRVAVSLGSIRKQARVGWLKRPALIR